MDKQIIIDYKNICENYSPKVGCTGTFDGRCIKEQCFTYKLLQSFKRKEQECEELIKNCFTVIQQRNVAEQQLDQLKEQLEAYKMEAEEGKEINAELKAENELLKKVSCKFKDYCNCDTEKLKATLQEIKEIAEPFCNACQEFEPEKNCSNCIYCDYSNILQKINKCEGDNEH